jgi:hypothetical protein
VLVVQGLQAGDLVVKENGLLLAREFRNAQDHAMQQTPAPGQQAPAPTTAEKK